MLLTRKIARVREYPYFIIKPTGSLYVDKAVRWTNRSFVYNELKSNSYTHDFMHNVN